MINEETNKELNSSDDPTLNTTEEVADSVAIEETADPVVIEETKSELTVNDKSYNDTIIDYLNPDILKIKKVKFEELDSNIAKEETDFDYDLDLFPNISQNQITKGTTVNVSDKDVCIDIGFKTEGMIPLSAFSEIP